MTSLNWRETVGKGLKPVLTYERLDHVKYVGYARRFVRDWAIAFGFWDDGVLEKEQSLTPIDLKASAQRTKAKKQASLTLYIDKTDAVTLKVRTFLKELEARPKEIDISDDDVSRKWLADEQNGARPPQLFIEGKRIGGLAELEKLHAEGKLLPLVFPTAS